LEAEVRLLGLAQVTTEGFKEKITAKQSCKILCEKPEDGNSVTPRTSLLPRAAAEADALHLTHASLAGNVLLHVLLEVVSMIMFSLVSNDNT